MSPQASRHAAYLPENMLNLSGTVPSDTHTGSIDWSGGVAEPPLAKRIGDPPVIEQAKVIATKAKQSSR